MIKEMIEKYLYSVDTKNGKKRYIFRKQAKSELEFMYAEKGRLFNVYNNEIFICYVRKLNE